jgi:hypothetical protein
MGKGGKHCASRVAVRSLRNSGNAWLVHADPSPLPLSDECKRLRGMLQGRINRHPWSRPGSGDILPVRLLRFLLFALAFSLVVFQTDASIGHGFVESSKIPRPKSLSNHTKKRIPMLVPFPPILFLQIQVVPSERRLSQPIIDRILDPSISNEVVKHE